MASSLIKRMFYPNSFVSEEEKLGEIPSNKNVYKNTLDLAIPVLADGFLVSIFALIDTATIKTMGNEAIAAVSIVGEPRMISLMFIFALNSAVTTMIAKKRGKRDEAGAKQVLKQSLLVSFVISVFSAIVMTIFSKSILKIAGAEDLIIKNATTFFIILMIGHPFAALSSTMFAAFHGAGFTKLPMVANFSSMIVKIVLNIVLINGYMGFPKMGVVGVGVSNLISFAIPFFFGVFALRDPAAFLSLAGKSGWKPDKKVLKEIFYLYKYTIPDQLFTRIGFFAYAIVVASLGTELYATHILISNITNIAFVIGNNFAPAATSLAGQSLGAKRPDMSIIYIKTCQRIAWIMSAAFGVVLVFFGKGIMSFLSDSIQVQTQGAFILKIVAIAIFVQSAQMIYLGGLRGIGDIKYLTTVSLLSIMIFKPLITYIFAYVIGLQLEGVWIGFTLEQLNRGVLGYTRFKSKKWMKNIET